jgi:uncharacterized protein with HEPN domain
MKERQAIDYFNDMQKAASDASHFIKGMDSAAFAEDLRTKHAVGLCFVILGSAASHLCETYPEIVEEHPDLPWNDMFGLVDRTLHSAFDRNFSDIWALTQDLLPVLLSQIESGRHWQAQGE